MTALRLLLMLLLLGLLPACTIKREWDGEVMTQDRLDNLNRANTKAEVLELVGPPSDMGIRMDGSVFVYRFRVEESDNLNLSFFQATFDYTTLDRRTARLVVFFDKFGRKTGQGFDNAQERHKE